MSGVHVIPVETRRQQKLFFRLPWELYADDPLWIPPLRSNQLGLLGYKPHPFHDDAEMQTFLATRDGRPCGRIAAIVHHAHLRLYGEKRGYFGFFESVDDQEVADRLFDAALGWLRQQGMSAVRGPMNPSFNYEVGMLVQGFDSPPTFMMTYNPPFYPQLVEQYGGFQRAHDLYAYWGHKNILDEQDPKLRFLVEEATRRFDLKLRHMSKSNFRDEIRTFLRIYNVALQNVWGFVPLSESEVEHISAELKHLILPELTAVAEVEGRPVGCVFALPDYNPRIKKADGKLFPTGFLRLLWRRHAIKKVRVVAASVVPEYQRWGLGLVLLDQLVPDALKWGMEEAEFSWIAESNELSWKSLERGGAIRQKTYRIYDRDLGPAEERPPTPNGPAGQPS